MSPRPRPLDRAGWDDHLARFHHDRPGITEDILSKCRDDRGVTPYQWLTHGVDLVARTLDVACGSAPTRGLLGPGWVGVDRSPDELDRAVASGASAVVRADATGLPFADHSFDGAVSSMGLMLVDPIDDALDEVRRVVAAGGTLHLLVRTGRPLRLLDALRYLRLFTGLRSTSRFPPSALLSHTEPTLAAAGFEVVSDERRRFEFHVATADDAQRFVESLYLPGVDAERIRQVADGARRWVGRDLGVPFRRIVARATATVTSLR